jgi:hypothetical protein
LAQAEGAGNPMARTYWRWNPTRDPFAIYRPASSSVGIYQMTDAAFAEARHCCIRHHTVVEDGCSLAGLGSRILPSRAVELTAVYLDRNVTAIVARLPKRDGQSAAQQELASINHLCGADLARGWFARRGFHLTVGERCGDHDVATYLAQIDAMKREFLGFADDRGGGDIR